MVPHSAPGLGAQGGDRCCGFLAGTSPRDPSILSREGREDSGSLCAELPGAVGSFRAVPGAFPNHADQARVCHREVALEPVCAGPGESGPVRPRSRCRALSLFEQENLG